MSTPAASKVDLFKEHKSEYAQKKTPTFVEVGKAQYLAIDGEGAPGGEAFQAAIGAMYAMAYTIKMTSKKNGRDYVVCKLEGIWGADGDFDSSAPESCRWTLMIRTPEFIRSEELKGAAEKIAAKNDCPEAAHVELRSLREGKCVQILHVGPYEEEGPSINAMRAFCEREGVAFAGAHHEIYLSDPRRVEPAKLKTILRYPVY